jgi:hypothetical protein
MLFNAVLTRNLVSCFLVVILSLQAFASPLHCKSTFKSETQKITKAHWEQPGNIFANSLSSTITSSIIWLSTVQALKYFSLSAHGAEFLTTAFLITVPLDVGLTITSHWIALGKLAWLKKFAEGSYVKPKFQFWSRVAANVTIASTGIVGSWAIANGLGANININAQSILAAIFLCSLVYPSLQLTKPYLFNKIPNIGMKSDKEKLKYLLANEYYELGNLLKENANINKINQKDAEALFVQMLDLVLSLKDWESKITPDIGSKLSLKSQKILADINNAKEQDSTEQLLPRRQRLIESLLKDLENAPIEEKQAIKEALKIEEISIENSIAVHALISNSRKRRAALLFGASLIDQAIAVGFAGGVLLYSTTHWAETGELPLFLQNL